MRTILLETDIDAATFYRLLNSYVKKRRDAGEGIAKAEKSSFKTNLVAALSAPKLQILYFERFLELLNPKKVRFTITLTWRDNTKQSYSVDLDMADNSAEDRSGNSWDD